MRQQQQSALASHLVIIQVTLLLCFSWFNPSHSFQNYAQLCHDRFTPSTPRLNKILVPARVDSYNDDESAISSWGRRLFLGSTLLFLPQPKVSVAESQVLPVVANLDALLDLPPVTNGCIRIFLCRHGQTENNRLRKVQGARVDPPINANGVQQAINLGKTLHRLDPTPDLFFASNLQRAQMTAQLAASQIDPKINIQCLTALSEVDFGPTAEGQPVALAKAGMQATYAAWATGRIDYRPQGGQGETGRDVLERALEAITALTSAASQSPKGNCVAVTHSTFLRILLAMALDIPLFEAASMDVVNGGVSIIDVPRDLRKRPLERNSKLFTGLFTQDIAMEIPICHVIRINEMRHLPTVPAIA